MSEMHHSSAQDMHDMHTKKHAPDGRDPNPAKHKAHMAAGSAHADARDAYREKSPNAKSLGSKANALSKKAMAMREDVDVSILTGENPFADYKRKMEETIREEYGDHDDHIMHHKYSIESHSKAAHQSANGNIGGGRRVQAAIEAHDHAGEEHDKALEAWEKAKKSGNETHKKDAQKLTKKADAASDKADAHFGR